MCYRPRPHLHRQRYYPAGSQLSARQPTDPSRLVLRRPRGRECGTAPGRVDSMGVPDHLNPGPSHVTACLRPIAGPSSARQRAGSPPAGCSASASTCGPPRRRPRRFKFAHTREVPSVCPYCAVGCGQLVSVRDGADRQHRGQPRQPDQPRHALPQGRGHLPARRQPEPRRPRSGIARPARPTGTRRRRSTGPWTGSPSGSRQTRDATFTRDLERRRTRDGQAGREAGQPLRRRSPRSAGRRWTTSGTTSSSS